MPLMQPRPRHDPFYRTGEINKASLVMTTETDIVPRELGGRIADAASQVIEKGNKLGGAGPEPLLTRP